MPAIAVDMVPGPLPAALLAPLTQSTSAGGPRRPPWCSAARHGHCAAGNGVAAACTASQCRTQRESNPQDCLHWLWSTRTTGDCTAAKGVLEISFW